LTRLPKCKGEENNYLDLEWKDILIYDLNIKVCKKCSVKSKKGNDSNSRRIDALDIEGVEARQRSKTSQSAGKTSAIGINLNLLCS